jgi:UDP-glucuronate decarboxylase
MGNPNEFSMLQLAELILDITQSRSKIIFQELPMDDPKQRKPDISKAKSLLGWSPTVPLHDGLVRTIEDFKNRL